MNPIYLNIFLFCAAIISAIFCFIKVPRFKEDFIASYKGLVVVVIITVLAKYPFFQNYFFGLEYEDSFVYDACARSYLYFQDFSVDPFLTKACTIGALNDCQIFSTYSGHLITFPSIVYFFFSIFGYSPISILFINFFFSIVSVILIFLLSKTLLNNKTFPFIVSLIYSLTPIMNLFHTSGLSETFSSTFVLLFLYLYLTKFSRDINYHGRIYNYIHWSAIILSFAFAILIKRENLILIILPLLTIFSKMDKNSIQSQFKRITPLLITILACILFYHYYIDITGSNRAELTDASGNPFSFDYIYVLLPLFLKSYLTFEWYFIFTYLFFIGIILILFKYRKHKNFILILFLFLIYVFIYSIHYRSYYFVKSNNATTFETLRYISNFFPLYCIIAGLPMYYLFDFFRRKFIRNQPLFKIITFFVITSLVILLIVQSQVLKSEFSKIEYDNRILPVTMTINTLNDNDVLVTDEPLLFQIFADPSFSIVDLYSLGKYFQESDLEELVKNENVYYLKKPFHSENIQIERHPSSFRIINEFRQKSVISVRGRFQLIKLSVNNEL